MPKINLGIDSSGAVAGARQFDTATRQVAQRARDLTRQIQQLDRAFANVGARSGGGLGRAIQEQTRALRQLNQQRNATAQAVQNSNRAEQQAVQTARRTLQVYSQVEQTLRRRIQLERQLGIAIRQRTRSERAAIAVTTRAGRAFSAAGRRARGAAGSTGALNTQLALLSKVSALAIGPLSGVGARIGALTSVIEAFGVAYTAMFATIVGTGVAIAASVAVYAKFEKTLAQLSALTGFTGDSLNELAAEARKLGRDTTLSAIQVAEGFRIVGSLRPELLKSKEALAEVTESAIVLAEASGLELPEAARALTVALNQFNLPATESERIINVLAASARLGAATIPEMAVALSKSGAIAKVSGLSFEQTSAGLETLAKSGLSAQEFGTGFRNILLRLTTAQDDFNPKIVGLATALDNVAKASLKPAEFLKLFGARQVVLGQILLDNRKAFATLTDDVTGTTEAYTAQGRQTNTLIDDFKLLGSAIVDLALKIGEIFTPYVRGAVQGLTEFTLAVSDAFTFMKNDIISIFTGEPISEIIIKEFVSEGEEKVLARIADIGRRMREAAQFGHIDPTEEAHLTGLLTALVTAYDRLNKKMLETAEAAKKTGEEQEKNLGPVPGDIADIIDNITNLKKVEEQLNIGGKMAADMERARQKAEELFRELLGGQPLENIAKTLNVAATQDAVTKAIQARIFEEDQLTSRIKDGEQAEQARARELATALEKSKETVETFQQRTDQIVRETAALSVNKIESQVQLELIQAETDLRKDATNATEAQIQAMLNAREAAAYERAEREAQIKSIEALTKKREAAAKKQAEQAARAIQEPFITAARNIQNTISGAFKDLFKGEIENFQDFADRVLDIFIDMAAEIATLKIFQPIVAGASTPGVGIGGGFASLFGAAPNQTGIGQETKAISNKFSVDLSNKINEKFGSDMIDMQGETVSVMSGAAATLEDVASATEGMEFSLKSLPERLGGVFVGALIGGGIGSSISGTGGGILGAIGGAAGSGLFEAYFGEQLGKFAGPLGGAFGGILGGFAGKLFKSDASREDQIQGAAGTGALLGGVTAAAIAGFAGIAGGAGGLAGAVGGVTGGALGGAAVGSVVPIIGTVLGLIVGLVLGSIFADDNKTPFLQITTDLVEKGVKQAGVTTPLGQVSVGGRNISDAAQEQTEQAILTLDRAISSVLTDAERYVVTEQLTASGRGGTLQNAIRKSDDFFNSVAFRYRSIIDALGGDSSAFLPGKPRTFEELFASVQKFVEGRRELYGIIEGLRRDEIPDAVNELAKLAAEFEAASASAEVFGVNISEVVRAFDEGVVAITKRFTDAVTLDTLDITDPFASTLKRLDESYNLRVEEAVALGVDLLDIERLYALKRKQALEEELAPITDFITGLRRGEAERLSGTAIVDFDTAQFDSIVAQYHANNASISDVTSAASTLLQSFEATFGRTAAFDAQQAELERLLITIMSERQLTAGGEPSIPEVALTTTANTGPIAVEFAASVPEIATADYQLRIADSIEAGNAEQAGLLRTLIAATDRNTAEVALLREEGELASAAAAR